MQMLNLPVLSAFAGLTVGCTPFLKGLLFGPSAPFGFVRDCLQVTSLCNVSLHSLLSCIRYSNQGCQHQMSLSPNVLSYSSPELLLRLLFCASSLSAAVYLGVQVLGAPMIPCMMMVLGAVL